MRATTDNIFETLDKLRKENVGKTVSWQTIVSTINATGMKIKNWMVVRNVLQYLINQGLMTRTADVTVEEFACAEGEAS